MSTVATEQVLVIPTELFHRLGHFQGFCAEVERYLEELLSPEHASYMPRALAEDDPSFKQLIPYVIFRHVDERGVASVFQYRRGKGQGEARLHSKRSVGIGGHISRDDANQRDLHPYDEGMRRELAEEVLVEGPVRERCVGMINDDQTEVGRVHLGIVHLFDVARPTVRSRETDLLDAGFRPVAELLEQLDQFETWSQITLAALFGG